MDKAKLISLRMERQHLINKACEDEYIALYRDMQPGLNVYWNGFGMPPSLTFRADFDDIEFNRRRQAERELVKGRFAGGNLGWVERGEMELFACLYRKPLPAMTFEQSKIFELIERMGPISIQQIKEETGMLVKEITPILHRLQEAFLVYEDQYDGEWDRGWYAFYEMFPNASFDKYSRTGALKIVLQRFAFRNVLIDADMAKSFYRLPAKEIKAAVDELVSEGVLVPAGGGFMLKTDAAIAEAYQPKPLHFVYAIHRNDFLYKSNEPLAKRQAEKWLADAGDASYDREILQYLLIDGELHGACVGHFRNGPYDLNDVVCDLPNASERRDEIIRAITDVNYGRAPERFMGRPL
ncbi:MAG: hypothetical protein PHI27_00270 [Eubacteriales bacterium]|nr:hypothetical protein [Eubacteriales bacterium]MDD3880676.1 hypothetical protein [Eubacteriales bacterium]MDD4511690.1 hypothetical protein [Eubacteriales bacterium]